jgi:hypothetical protein
LNLLSSPQYEQRAINEVLAPGFNVAKALRTGGVFVARGHFGIFNGPSAQIDVSGNINKRLRSRRNWARTLTEVGFRRVDFYRNDAYLFINDNLPENNILVATK